MKLCCLTRLALCKCFLLSLFRAQGMCNLNMSVYEHCMDHSHITCAEISRDK